jgi:hypothetical protein
MAIVELNLNPSRRDLRIFGAAAAAALAMAGMVLARGRHPFGLHCGAGAVRSIALALYIAAAGAAVFAALRPQALRRPYVVLCILGYPIGLVVSWVMLAVVFYLVLTPIALLRRWRTGDPLGREFDRAASSYWTRRAAAPAKSRYFRQW